MKKFGNVYHRRNAAALAREIRALWPQLRGGWSRRDWNQQVLAGAHNHIAGMTRLDRANGIVRDAHGNEVQT